MEAVNCYFNMIDSNTSMEVFFKIFLKDYHFKLIPLIYFNRSLAHYEARKDKSLFNHIYNPGLNYQYSASTFILKHNKQIKSGQSTPYAQKPFDFAADEAMDQEIINPKGLSYLKIQANSLQHQLDLVKYFDKTLMDERVL